MNQVRMSTIASRLRGEAAVAHELSIWPVAWICIAIGTGLTLLNLRWPVTRNALCYAKAAFGIVQHHFDVLVIARDAAWTSGKPIFFSVLAAPLVWLTDANTGTILASFIGTSFFVAMAGIALARLSKRAALDPKMARLALAFVVFNPLVLYQFWSAYPDSLFGGWVLLAFILTDIVVCEPERDTRWHIVGLGAVIFLAIHTKVYGAVLGLACPVYLLMHLRPLMRDSRFLAAKIGTLSVAFAVLALLLVAAKLHIYPLLRFDDGDGFPSYESGFRDLQASNVALAGVMFAFAILLNFQAAVLFFANGNASRALRAAPTVFAGIYVLGLLMFDGTRFNMRYFLAAFPFVALALAAGVPSCKSFIRRGILIAYAAIACTLTGIFNVAAVEQLADPVLAGISAQDPYLAMWLDNLRLPVQMAIRRQIDVVNAKVPDGSNFVWSSDYYGTATHGLAPALGVKRGLDVQYVLTPSEIRAPSGPVFMVLHNTYEADARLQQVPSWATVQNLGYGVFRLDPISVDLTHASSDYVREGESIQLRAHVRTGDLLKAALGAVDIVDGDQTIGSNLQPPYELTWQHPSPGRHELRARVNYGETNSSISGPVVIYVGVPAIERVARPAGDLAIEAGNGYVQPEDWEVSLGEFQSVTGIYFDGLNLKRGMRISKAHLDLIVQDPGSRPSELEIAAELAPTAMPIKFQKDDLSRRPRTIARVRWNPGPWTTTGTLERSPDLSNILEEVIRQRDWRSGNSLMLLIRGSGKRSAQLPNAQLQGGPRLYIELSSDSSQ